MARVPSAVWVVDTKKEHIAVSEARKLGIPVVAILDTNCDPDEVNYPIPGNDDAIRSVALLTRVVADAVADGLIARAGAADGEEKPSADRPGVGSEEPLAEWERELAESGSPQPEAAADAPAADATAEAAPVADAPAEPVPAADALAEVSVPAEASAPAETRTSAEANGTPAQANGTPAEANGTPAEQGEPVGAASSAESAEGAE
jgi:small subunit ribosomal protein S2